MKLNIFDAQGNASAVALPPQEELVHHLTVLANGKKYSPFYADPGKETQSRSRITLILIDVSGSMNTVFDNGKTRFQAAKDATGQFVRDFKPGDRIAIVHFESHDVVETIMRTQFVESQRAAQQQIDHLPEPNHNTGLYSAIDTGLEVLKRQEGYITGTADTLLIVLTDGKNEVGKRGDDRNLLREADLEKVHEKVPASRIRVIAIGIGDADEMDADKLRRISDYRSASNAEDLNQSFSIPRGSQIRTIEAAFPLPRPDLSVLTPLHVRISLTASGVEGLDSNELLWYPPQIGYPSFTGSCSEDERSKLSKYLKNATSPDAPSPLLRWVYPALIFIGFGTLLLVLGLWVPRLIWPEQFLGQFQVAQSGSRRDHESQRSDSGAERRGTGVRERGEADETRVHPVNLTTSSRTRTRLGRCPNFRWRLSDGSPARFG